MASGADRAARWLRGEPSGQETPEPDGHAQALILAARRATELQALRVRLELLEALLAELGVDVDDDALEAARRRLGKQEES